MGDSESRQLHIRVPNDVYDQLTYFSTKSGMSLTEYVNDAIALRIRHQLGDYDLPVAEIARLNQLVDVVTSLSRNVRGLEDVVVSGFNSLLGLTRGDNYLVDDDTFDSLDDN